MRVSAELASRLSILYNLFTKFLILFIHKHMYNNLSHTILLRLCMTVPVYMLGSVCTYQGELSMEINARFQIKTRSCVATNDNINSKLRCIY